MDETYRYQRLIYDITRKYYLLGRDGLIDGMRVQDGQTVLEVACGTGRNLAQIKRHYPRAHLYGFDISEQMLTSARAKLGSAVPLALGDACDFDPDEMFGVAQFDHIVLSYSLSMIPDWKGAIVEAKRHLAPGGRLHIVDFGDQARLPGWFKQALRGWLARFHVAPRDTLVAELRAALEASQSLDQRPLFRGYAIKAVLTN